MASDSVDFSKSLAVASDTWLQVPEDWKEASAPQSAPVCLQRHLPFPDSLDMDRFSWQDAFHNNH